MVCIRCKMVVQSELEKLTPQCANVELGEVEIMGDLTGEQQERFRVALLKTGLELMDDQKTVLIEKIKGIVIELIHYAEQPVSAKFSIYLSEKMHHNYGYLSNLFSKVQGISLEKYLIYHKIEKVKEFLVYQGLTLSEIADRMNYSSVAHLSAQFKKTTGLTPSHFKELKEIRTSILKSRARNG